MENTWLSPYNLDPQVMDTAFMPDRVTFYDTTLRDGEQTVGVVFRAEDKLEIAKHLGRAGVDRIEAGMPVVSKEDFQAVQSIVQEVEGADVWGFCRCIKADIDACVEAGVKSVICEIPLSEYKLKAYSFNSKDAIKKLVEHLDYAKGKGLKAAFFAVDATRTSLPVLKEAYLAAVEEAGADEVVLVDTLGVATPETMYYLTRRVKEWVDVPLMVHCHNDFGQATACSLAAVRGGADAVQVTVNGLGEKTGNADLAEVALGVNLLYGLSTSIDLTALKGLSARVEAISKISLSPLKPVVGEKVFQRESGVAVAQLINYPPAVEGYSPEIIGSKREVLLGKKSGRRSVGYKLEKLQIDVTKEKLDQIVALVKERGTEKGDVLNDQEFMQIVEQVTQ